MLSWSQCSRSARAVAGGAPCAWPPLLQLARALSCCPPHAAHRLVLAMPHRWRLSSDLLPCDYGCTRLCAPTEAVEQALLVFTAASSAAGPFAPRRHAAVDARGSASTLNITSSRRVPRSRGSDCRSLQRTHLSLPQASRCSVGMCCSPKATAGKRRRWDGCPGRSSDAVDCRAPRRCITSAV